MLCYALFYHFCFYFIFSIFQLTDADICLVAPVELDVHLSHLRFERRPIDRGSNAPDTVNPEPAIRKPKSLAQTVRKLIFCSAGMMVSFRLSSAIPLSRTRAGRNRISLNPQPLKFRTLNPEPFVSSSLFEWQGEPAVLLLDS